MRDCLYHISPSNDPFFNLALEEYLLRTVDSTKYDYLLLYVSSPTVVVGRNQNVFQEANLWYCQKQNIQVARRISGGGTVYHDAGNINWTFITTYDSKKINQYDYFSRPILNVLKNMRLNAYTNQRNGIEINGFKISGQAQFTNRKNILSHGTLLIHSDIKQLNQAITLPDHITVRSKASSSVRSEVKNVNDFLASPVKVDTVIQKIANHAKDRFDPDVKAEQFQNYWYQYTSREWIYARSPQCEIDQFIWINNQKIPATLYIEKGKIKNIHSRKSRIMNDFSALLLNQDYEKRILYVM